MLIAVALAGCGGASPGTPSPMQVVTAEPTVAVTPAPTVASTPEPMATASIEPTPSPAPPDPCQIISQAEAEKLAGRDLRSPLPEGKPPVRCVWPTPLTGSVAQVEIDLGDGAQKFLDIERKLDHALDPVPGLGDEAYVENDTVFVRTGSTWFSIHLIGHSSSDAYRQPLENLARVVLSRLQP